jgi:hypothetical protein
MIMDASIINFCRNMKPPGSAKGWILLGSAFQELFCQAFKVIVFFLE